MAVLGLFGRLVEFCLGDWLSFVWELFEQRGVGKLGVFRAEPIEMRRPSIFSRRKKAKKSSALLFSLGVWRAVFLVVSSGKRLSFPRIMLPI